MDAHDVRRPTRDEYYNAAPAQVGLGSRRTVRGPAGCPPLPSLAAVAVTNRKNEGALRPVSDLLPAVVTNIGHGRATPLARSSTDSDNPKQNAWPVGVSPRRATLRITSPSNARRRGEQAAAAVRNHGLQVCGARQ